MRGFKRFILLLILLIIGSPIAVGAMALSKDATVPEYLVNFNYQDFDVEATVNEKVESMLLNNVLGNKSVYIDEELVSKALYTSIKKNLETEVVIPDLNNAHLSFKYIWVTFDNNILSLYALVGINNVETTITFQLAFEDHDEDIQIGIYSVKIGKMPIPKIVFTKVLQLLEDKDILTIRDEYPNGEINYDKLYITLNDDFINGMLEEALESDMLVFESIELTDKRFILNYGFNPENQQAKAIDDTVNEVKRLLSSEETKTSVTDVLDTTDEDQAAFNDSFIDALDLLDDKITVDFTEEELQLLTELTENYSNLSQATQEAVTEALMDNMDPQVKANFEQNVLGEYGEDATMEDFLDQILCGGNNEEEEGS